MLPVLLFSASVWELGKTCFSTGTPSARYLHLAIWERCRWRALCCFAKNVHRFPLLRLLQLLGLEDVQLPLGPAIEAAYEELLNLPLEEGYRSASWDPQPACTIVCMQQPAAAARSERRSPQLAAGQHLHVHVHRFRVRPRCIGPFSEADERVGPAAACSELARLGKEKLLFAARDRLRSVRGRVGMLSPTVQVRVAGLRLAPASAPSSAGQFRVGWLPAGLPAGPPSCQQQRPVSC